MPESPHPLRRDDPRRLVAVALGDAPADLVVRGGVLANVYTGELLEGWGVAVAGTRIALVSREVGHTIGPATAVIEAEGQVIAPGYLDAHTHLDCIHRLDHFLAAAVPTGLTAAVTETNAVANVGGYPAVAAFVDRLSSLPITVMATAPTISYLCSDRGDGQPMIDTEEMARLLEEPAVAGLGEAYWPAVLAGQAELPLLMAKADSLGKRVEGHSAGARGRKLAATVAAGVRSCHESTTPGEVRERLRLGLTTMIRDGSIRRDSAALRGLLTGISPRRLVLATDSVWPHDLLQRGCLDESARQALGMGLTAMQALQAITLTPAEHFHLEGRLGGLAPGRQADILLLSDLAQFRPSLVLARGQVVARDGCITVPIPPVSLPLELFPAPRLSRPLGPDDLRIPAPAGRERIRVRVIRFSTEIVTTEEIRELPVRNGALHADPAGDLLKVVVLDRHGRGQIARGFVSGWGLREGALATSESFETSNLVLIGGNDTDMLVAAERMLALGGGMTVAARGAIRAEVSLAMGGVASNRPLPTLAAEIDAFQAALHALGCVRRSPFLSAQVVTFTAIPALRIRERGLWDVRRNHVVPLVADGGAEGEDHAEP